MTLVGDLEDTNLFAQQESNSRRSRWVVIGFVLFFAWLGFGGDWIYYQITLAAPADQYHHTVPLLGLAMTALAIGMAWYGATRGADRVIWSCGAWELVEPVTDAQRRLIDVVEEMAIAAGIPRPRIHILDDAAPNAFATGRDPAHSHVVVTTGLLDVCSRDELQAVIGHEVGHIKNLDVRLMTLLAALVGVIALINDGMWRTLRGGIRLGGGDEDTTPSGGKRRSGVDGRLLGFVIVLWVVSWILAPVIVRLLAMCVSRKREYLADAMSAQFTRNPMALATALEKIGHPTVTTSMIRGGLAHLCIADPLGRSASLGEGAIADFLGTHPPLPMRIARLKAMAYQAQKRAGTYQSLPVGAPPVRA
ncbi:MAG: zinc metalloprotease HtpX [Gemmatimonadaceae bacterium]